MWGGEEEKEEREGEGDFGFQLGCLKKMVERTINAQESAMWKRGD